MEQSTLIIWGNVARFQEKKAKSLALFNSLKYKVVLRGQNVSHRANLAKLNQVVCATYPHYNIPWFNENRKAKEFAKQDM